jgi:hypothetical protein
MLDVQFVALRIDLFDKRFMEDIEKIRRVLISRKQVNLANMLNHSVGELSESSNYGHYLFSTLSTYYIYSPPSETDLLNSLREEDKKRIFDAVISVYPPKERAPEIEKVVYQIDFECCLDAEEGVETKKIDELDLPIVRGQLQKCEQRVSQGDFDGAVTSARSLLETICKHILNESDVKYEEGKNLPSYYKKVAKVLKMEPGLYKETETFQEVLSGFYSIVNGISSIRNVYGDSHGPNPQKIYRIDKRHAVLVVNASWTIAEYLVTAFEKQRNLR